MAEGCAGGEAGAVERGGVEPVEGEPPVGPVAAVSVA